MCGRSCRKKFDWYLSNSSSSTGATWQAWVKKNAARGGGVPMVRGLIGKTIGSATSENGGGTHSSHAMNTPERTGQRVTGS